MHYTSGTTGKPKGVKRKLNDFDPDVSAELFTGFFGLFGIPHREDQVHLCTSPNYHTAVTTFADPHQFLFTPALGRIASSDADIARQSASGSRRVGPL